MHDRARRNSKLGVKSYARLVESLDSLGYDLLHAGGHMPRKPQRPTSGRDTQGRSDARGQKLAGSIAVVAGATRGAGRGIARALAEAGAKVYCTGRSLRGNPSPYNRPETIEETAEMISAAGGAMSIQNVVQP